MTAKKSVRACSPVSPNTLALRHTICRARTSDVLAFTQLLSFGGCCVTISYMKYSYIVSAICCLVVFGYYAFWTGPSALSILDISERFLKNEADVQELVLTLFWLPSLLLSIGYALIGLGRVKSNIMTTVSLWFFYGCLTIAAAWVFFLDPFMGSIILFRPQALIFISIPTLLLIIGMIVNMFSRQDNSSTLDT